MSVLLHVSLRKRTPGIGVKFLVFFTFFINFFMKILIKSIIYCQTTFTYVDRLLDRLLMYVLKTVCQASLSSFLTWVSLAIFCLDKCQKKGNCLFSSVPMSLVGEITPIERINRSDESSWATYKCNILCPTTSCFGIVLQKRPISDRW